MNSLPDPANDLERLTLALVLCIVVPADAPVAVAPGDVREHARWMPTAQVAVCRMQAAHLLHGCRASLHPQIAAEFCSRLASIVEASDAAAAALAEDHRRGVLAGPRRARAKMAAPMAVLEPLVRGFARVCAFESGSAPARVITNQMFVYGCLHRVSDFDLARCRQLALERLARWPWEEAKLN